VLIVCYNRRETTLMALRALKRAREDADLRVVLFDDGSTDGTAEAVSTEFPDTIIVEGDGSFFWNRGLHAAWARARSLDVDAFLWLNDDVVLDPDALTRLKRAWAQMTALRHDRKFILVGATRSSSGSVSYGGYRTESSPFAMRFRMVQPQQGLAKIDTFNGNIVLVPSEVTKCIGLNDPAYHHNFGDTEYGLRATRNGIDVRLAEGTLGVCEPNLEKYEKGLSGKNVRLIDRWRKVNTHHGLPFKSWLRFTRRYSGIWFPLHFILPYRRLLGIK
jgi:GT2 family glycosyltransferase